MLIRQTLLTMVFFAIGSSLAFADTSHLMNGHENGGQTNQQKLETLEAKIKALESRIDKYLPKTSPEVKLGSNPYAPEMVKKMVSWSSKDHLMEANAHHQTVETLEQKINKLNDRIDRFNKKPYLDTKGFRRASLKRIKGNVVQDLREATLKTVWHREQAEKVMLSESAHFNLQQES